MSIVTFNLPAHIRAYNKSCQQSISLTECFGVITLQPDSLKLMSDAVTAISSCHAKFCGITNIYQRRKFRRGLASNVRNNQFSDVRSGLVWMREDNRAMSSHHWYIEQQRRLINPKFWEELEGATKDEIQREALNQLHSEWVIHGDYGHYPSEALCYVAKKALVAIEKYRQASWLELSYRKKRRQLPADILSAYQGYLIELAADLQAEKVKLCWAMLARLKRASSKEDLSFDDVILDLAEKLLTLGVVKVKNGLNREPRRSLTPESFVFFHRYIIAHGTDQQKTALYDLSWFKEHHLFSVMDIGGRCLIPKLVDKEQLIPTYYFSKLLFPRRWFRLQFYQKQFGLMVRLRMLPALSQDDIRTSIPWLNNFFTELNQIEKDLLAADQASEHWSARGVWGWFNRATNRFIAIWLQFSHQYQSHLLQRKLSVIHFIAEKLKETFECVVVPRTKLNPALRELMISKIAEIEQQMSSLSVSDEDVQQFADNKRYIESIVDRCAEMPGNVAEEPESTEAPSQESALSWQSVVVESVEEIQPLIARDVDLSPVASSAISLHACYQPMVAERQVVKRATSLAMVKVSHAAPTLFKTKDDRVEHKLINMNHISSLNVDKTISFLLTMNLAAINEIELVELMRTFASKLENDPATSSESLQRLDLMMKHLFVDYLKACAAIKSEPYFKRTAKRFHCVESLLIRYAGPDMVERVEKLVATREGDGWLFLFKLQSKSFLQSYQGHDGLVINDSCVEMKQMLGGV